MAFAVSIAYRFLMFIDLFLFYPIYILCFAISHFAVFALFRQNIHLKLFAIFAIEGIMLVSYKMHILNLTMLIAINVILYDIFVWRFL